MREWPIVKFWYGKGAKYSSIEELIDSNPSWFLWAVDTFQDITPSQAQYWLDKYPELGPIPNEYVKDVVPYRHTKDSPDSEYMNLCEGRIGIEQTLGYILSKN